MTSQPSTPPVVEAHRVRLTIAGTEILRGIDLCIARGESLAIMGPSGSGKSSLLYALSGMEAISAGTVAFEGQQLGGLSQGQLGRLRLERMGFVFQQPQLLKSLSLLDNIVLPGFAARARPRAAVVDRARDLLHRAGVADLEDRDLTEASGGQLQRIGICRALINDPAVVFADEPTGALDSTATTGILRLLHTIHNGGTTLVIVTHDPGVAAHAERVLMMSDGRLAGELALGPVGPDDADVLATRREQISSWLAASVLAGR